MENNDISDPDLGAVAGFLREQASICHTLTKAVFDTFCKETHRGAQDSTLKMIHRLVQSSATAAGAMSKLKAIQFRQTPAAKPENGDFAKTNSGSAA